MTYHIVLDTNVVVSGLRSQIGASYRVLELVADDRVRLHLSVPLLFEYESVLTRPEAGVPLSGEAIERFVDDLCAVGQNHAIFFLWRPHLRDPGDEMVLEAAIAGRCQYIITHNLRDFAGSGQFGIQAITPGHFLRILGEQR